ncbi:MAG TPA: hypothetical protein VKG03_02195 [Solirubrobacterales bacterium]|nr:hypothetical protein [Solirubrobacterales bacterium]
MREKLNENPLMQVAVIGVLLLAAGIFVMSSMGGQSGGEESESSAASPTSAGTEGTTGAPATSQAPVGLSAALAMVSQASAGSAPPLPHPVLAAWNADKTVVLLFVHDGGIDDQLVKNATARLAALPEAATFIVPASKISRYAAVTEGVGVSRVPALVVVRPKRLHQTIPTASVSYGFQSGESVVQAVIDAGYKGPTVPYHP